MRGAITDEVHSYWDWVIHQIMNGMIVMLFYKFIEDENTNHQIQIR